MDLETVKKANRVNAILGGQTEKTAEGVRRFFAKNASELMESAKMLESEFKMDFEQFKGVLDSVTAGEITYQEAGQWFSEHGKEIESDLETLSYVKEKLINV